MSDSLFVDLLRAFYPLALGVSLLLAGRWVHRMPRGLLAAALVLVILLIAVVGSTYAGVVDDRAGPILYWIGGSAILACWCALFLLGVVWGAPTRRISPGFLVFLVAVAGLVVLTSSSGRIYWRIFAAQMWQNRPGPEGGLAQTTGFTCSPAAAAMLLHYHSIPATEGEMAYLADTSLLGTDPYNMAHALSRKVQHQGLTARVCRSSYEDCLHHDNPFIALVDLPQLGGHALLVRKLTTDQADIIDPRYGTPQTILRAAFEEWWDRRIITLHRITSP